MRIAICDSDEKYSNYLKELVSDQLSPLLFDPKAPLQFCPDPQQLYPEL